MDMKEYRMVLPPELTEDDDDEPAGTTRQISRDDCNAPRYRRRWHLLSLPAALLLIGAGFLAFALTGQRSAETSANDLESVESKFSIFRLSLAAYEKMFGDNDPFQFQCPVPGLGSPVSVNLPGGGDKNAACCSAYSSLGWPFQFQECDGLGLCTTCWEETTRADMQRHPAIGYAAAAWAASVTVTGEAKPKYGWLGQSLKSGLGDLVSGDLSSGLAVDDAEVKARRMQVRLGRGIMGGQAKVCPAIDDWDIDMLNEAKENIHARVFKSSKAKLAIVAFRGTQLQSVKNWHVDADIHRVPFDLKNGNFSQVHEGFINALDHILPQVKRWVDGYVFGLFDAVPADWDLIFAGHSLGGALALLAATRAELEGWSRRPRATIVFGAPRVADASLDEWWQAKGLCDRLIRVNGFNDIIHVMPFHKMWSAWNVATDAVDCFKSPLDCLKHSAYSAQGLLSGGGKASRAGLEISTQWAHVCPQSEVVVPSRVKGVNEELEEFSLFGGVLAHLTDNCFYGYAYGVMHSNITDLDSYCGLTPAVCSDLSDMRPKP
eukprot:TRINITY_DN64480_c0_g1_i1.p1 TRINITY_DN64480_c0_g1~~TRINITY_DN64480_c0_g1_i1.p1  ORF type:complete len:547 (-),score=110.24 TRINITY_DN64480_c0_g1_i1:38-1678(-)